MTANTALTKRRAGKNVYDHGEYKYRNDYDDNNNYYLLLLIKSVEIIVTLL